MSDGRTFRRAGLPTVAALLCFLGASPPAALAQPPNGDAANRPWQRGAIEHALKMQRLPDADRSRPHNGPAATLLDVVNFHHQRFFDRLVVGQSNTSGYRCTIKLT